jgi:hypothetical protein
MENSNALTNVILSIEQLYKEHEHDLIAIGHYFHLLNQYLDKKQQITIWNLTNPNRPITAEGERKLNQRHIPHWDHNTLDESGRGAKHPAFAKKKQSETEPEDHYCPPQVQYADPADITKVIRTEPLNVPDKAADGQPDTPKLESKQHDSLPDSYKNNTCPKITFGDGPSNVDQMDQEISTPGPHFCKRGSASVEHLRKIARLKHQKQHGYDPDVPFDAVFTVPQDVDLEDRTLDINVDENVPLDNQPPRVSDIKVDLKYGKKLPGKPIDDTPVPYDNQYPQAGVPGAKLDDGNSTPVQIVVNKAPDGDARHHVFTTEDILELAQARGFSPESLVKLAKHYIRNEITTEDALKVTPQEILEWEFLSKYQDPNTPQIDHIPAGQRAAFIRSANPGKPEKPLLTPGEGLPDRVREVVEQINREAKQPIWEDPPIGYDQGVEITISTGSPTA